MTTPRRIGILAYDGVQALDLVGPADTFASVVAPPDAARGELPYEVVIIGLTGRRAVSEGGVVLHADTTRTDRLQLDTLFIPGGCAMRTPATGTRTAALVRALAPRLKRLATVCTGIYGVAPTGLLDGRRVTTHWRFAADLQRRFPKLRVDANAIWTSDGKFRTSAGISAGIDLSLSLIEEDLGPRAALGVARELVVYMKRPGGQNQFSEPLQYQLRSASRFADLVAWIGGHLSDELSVEQMAEQVFLSPRQFTRAFTTEIGVSPAAFVEAQRMAEASRRLANRRMPIESIARSVGYASADVFRRAFERQFGVPPGEWRLRFAQAGSGAAGGRPRSATATRRSRT
jgi:transcriptional regulator GlxA family with amidase domain